MGAKNSKQKNEKNRTIGFGSNLGAGPEEDTDEFEDTGERSTKTFMFPDQRTATATKKMMLKHDLRDGAREMNIVPGMHTSLILLQTLGDDHFCAHLAARARSDMTYLMVPHNWKPWYYKLDGVPSSSLTPSCNSMDASLRRRMMSNPFITAYCWENCAR